MSASSGEAAFVQRIERLEKEVRRQRGFALIASAVASLFLFSAAGAATGPMTIRDADGTATQIGGGYINFIDGSGKVRMYVGFTQSLRPHLSFHDGSGTERIFLGETNEGDPAFRQFDVSGKARTYAGTYTDGSYGFEVHDKSGTSAWHAYSNN
jgi:hypothetical protein